MDKCGLNPGRLRHRVELHAATTTRDGYGQPKETFAKYADVWASIESLSGREFVQAEQVNGEITHKVIIRHQSDLVRTDRIIYGTRIFEIVRILNIEERGRYQELECKERV